MRPLHQLPRLIRVRLSPQVRYVSQHSSLLDRCACVNTTRVNVAVAAVILAFVRTQDGDILVASLRRRQAIKQQQAEVAAQLTTQAAHIQSQYTVRHIG